MSGVARACGNGVSRLAVGQEGGGRTPVRRAGNHQWVSVLGSDCFLGPSSSEDSELIWGHLFPSNSYSFHRTHRMPDIVLGSGNTAADQDGCGPCSDGPQNTARETARTP